MARLLQRKSVLLKKKMADEWYQSSKGKTFFPKCQAVHLNSLSTLTLNTQMMKIMFLTQYKLGVQRYRYRRVRSVPRFLSHGFGSVSADVLCVKRKKQFLPKFSLYFACQQKL